VAPGRLNLHRGWAQVLRPEVLGYVEWPRIEGPEAVLAVLAVVAVVAVAFWPASKYMATGAHKA